MRHLIVFILFILPGYGFSQFAVNASYLFDSGINDPWQSSHGIHIGVGMEGVQLKNPQFVFSLRGTLSYTQSPYKSVIDDVLFDMSAYQSPNSTGDITVRYQKCSYGIEGDLGYVKWEESKVEPYVTLGFRMEEYMSDIRYRLDDASLSGFIDESYNTFVETRSYGFIGGLGIKIKPWRRVFFDVRALYFGNIVAPTNQYAGMPDTRTFHIDETGTPTFDFVPRSYYQGINVRAGVIFLFGKSARE